MWFFDFLSDDSNVNQLKDLSGLHILGHTVKINFEI